MADLLDPWLAATSASSTPAVGPGATARGSPSTDASWASTSRRRRSSSCATAGRRSRRCGRRSPSSRSTTRRSTSSSRSRSSRAWPTTPRPSASSHASSSPVVRCCCSSRPSGRSDAPTTRPCTRCTGTAARSWPGWPRPRGSTSSGRRTPTRSSHRPRTRSRSPTASVTDPRPRRAPTSRSARSTRVFAPLAGAERRWISRRSSPFGTSALVLATRPSLTRQAPGSAAGGRGPRRSTTSPNQSPTRSRSDRATLEKRKNSDCPCSRG